MKNIFDMADQNSDNLKTRHKLLKEKHENQNNLDLFKNFIDFMRDKPTISINIRQGVLISFLIQGVYKNRYEVTTERIEELNGKRKIGISHETAMDLQLKPHKKERKIFNSTFECAEKFKYGALNIGGLGPEKFGEYCVIIKRKQSNEYSLLAFIKEDSLKYVEENSVDVERLSRDIANRECVPALVALKHENEIGGIPFDELASMICSNEGYIEAITKGEIKNVHIECVRMRQSVSNRFENDLYKALISELSDAEERYWLEAFINMRDLLHNLGIRVEVIDENGN
ncbi:hypothetical protein C5S53_15430 [Methanophagales archaeon]|nr:hypothetical protein C5S53_15430 [Methanophagales archaeon]